MEQNEKETIGVKNEENVESTPQTTQKSHEETAKKLKKQRTRQIVASLIGIAILAFGLWQIVCLFLDYSSNETSNDAQIEHGKSSCLRLYRKDLFQGTSGGA